MDDVKILQAEVSALRAERARLMAAPVPALSYYGDIEDVVAKIRERGVHPTEAGTVALWLERLAKENDDLRAELRDATTFS